MFKLVVLCVFATAFAEPDPQWLYDSALGYASYPAVIPAATTITQQSNLIAHPSPLIYSHLIKKRSADPEPEAKPDPQLLTYPSSIYYPNILQTPVVNPLLPGLDAYPYQALPLASHLIKKRSPQLIAPSTYIPYGYPSAYYPSVATPYVGVGAPIVGLHSIKKRSAALLTAPTIYSPTTYAGVSPLVTAASPYVSSWPYVASPYAYSTLIKK